MKLILMRHAEAAPGYPDETRELTARGVASLQNPPESLMKLLDEVDQIYVSPYLRTRQTLENLLPERSYQLCEYLVPESSPEQVAQWLQTLPPEATVMLVTHMPLVGDLSGWLTSGSVRYAPPFATAQIEVLTLDFPAAGLASSVTQFYLQG